MFVPRRRGDRGSSNGRTPDSGSGYQGSNPCPRTRQAGEIEKLNSDWPDGLAVRTVPSHGTIPGSIPGRVTTTVGSLDGERDLSRRGGGTPVTTHRLVMTPHLQRALKILQLSRMELCNMVRD